MPACPNCNNDILGKDLAKQPMLRKYRLCSHCGAKITVDPKTKQRQLISILLAGLVFVLTTGTIFYDESWLLLTAISLVVLVVFAWWSNRRVKFVPFVK